MQEPVPRHVVISSGFHFYVVFSLNYQFSLPFVYSLLSFTILHYQSNDLTKLAIKKLEIKICQNVGIK